jgi:hypothetical protein
MIVMAGQVLLIAIDALVSTVRLVTAACPADGR